MAQLTLRNLGYPSNSPPGTIAPAGIEVRAGVGPGPQGPPGITGPGGTGATGPTGAGGTGATGPSGPAGVNAQAAPPAAPTDGMLWVSTSGELFVFSTATGAWIQVGGTSFGSSAAIASATPPAGATAGALWTTINGELFIHNGVAWQQVF